MFILHYLLAGALAFMGALNSFLQSSVVLFNSSVFDLVLDLPVMAAYFVVQKVSVNGISEPTGICSASATEQCTWGIPGLLALRPVALPPSVLPRASKAVTLYRPEGTGLATLPTKAASSTGHESKSFDPLSSGEDVATIDLSLLPVDVLRRKRRCTRRTWSEASMLYLIWVYLAVFQVAVTLYVINHVKKAINFGNFELLVDFSELFPQAPATQANVSVPCKANLISMLTLFYHRTPWRLLCQPQSNLFPLLPSSPYLPTRKSPPRQSIKNGFLPFRHLHLNSKY